MPKKKRDDDIIPLSPEEKQRLGSPFVFATPPEEDDSRRVVPISISTVGRSIKLRDVFTLAGTIEVDSALVTVTAASGGTITDLKSFTFFPNELHLNSLIRISALGTYTSDGTRVVKITVGSGLAASHTEWNSMTSTAAVTTNQPWNLQWTGIVATIGPSGTLEAQMLGSINNVSKNDPNTATLAIATTGAVVVALTADWDGTDAGNTVTIRQFLIEVLN